MSRIYLIAPIYNEAPNLPALLAGWREIRKHFPEEEVCGILVDDGSQDETERVFEAHRGDFPVILLRHEKNLGPGAAFGTAFAALRGNLQPDDEVVTMEGDNTSRIDTLQTMILRRRREGLDVVLASPHAYGGGFTHTNSFRMFLSHCASGFARGILGLHGIHTTSSFFRVYRGEMILQLQERYGPRILERRGFEAMVELLMKLVRFGASISEVPMRLDTSRRTGPSKMKILRTIHGYLTLWYAARSW